VVSSLYVLEEISIVKRERRLRQGEKKGSWSLKRVEEFSPFFNKRSLLVNAMEGIFFQQAEAGFQLEAWIAIVFNWTVITMSILHVAGNLHTETTNMDPELKIK